MTQINSIGKSNFGNVQPLYYTIMRTIEEEYRNEPPGTLIPSETQLMKRFKTSRGTVQRAITELCRQDFLYRIQGKGTYVSRARIERQGYALLSFTEEIQRHGYQTSAQILRFEVITPEKSVRESLQLGEDDAVYVIERVRYIEDDPMAYVLSYIPKKLAPELTSKDVEYSVYDALGKAGCEPVKARDSFRARAIDESMAKLLNCQPGDAVFLSKRIAYTENDVPVEFVEGIIKGQDYALTIEPWSSKQNSKAYFHHNLGN